MMMTVTLFLSPGTSVLMGVCRRTATSSAYLCTRPQRMAATSKISRGEFEDTLSSPFLFSVGRGLYPSWPWFEGRGEGGCSVTTTVQRRTSGEGLGSKRDRLHSKWGLAEVAMAQKQRPRVCVCYRVRFLIAREIYKRFFESPPNQRFSFLNV